MKNLEEKVMSVSSVKKRYKIIINELGEDIFTMKWKGIMGKIMPEERHTLKDICYIKIVSNKYIFVGLKNGNVLSIEY